MDHQKERTTTDLIFLLNWSSNLRFAEAMVRFGVLRLVDGGDLLKGHRLGDVGCITDTSLIQSYSSLG